jgi:LPPG:FO 2-phospho-L-lactate transferase
VLDPGDLTIIVNVGDDDVMYGVHVSPDLDTVLHTLAGLEGPHGWGLAHDTFVVMDRLAELGVDTSFRLGDRDLAGCLVRTNALGRGQPLSAIISEFRQRLGVAPAVLPASDDPVRTKIRVAGDLWLDFQDYFVIRRHRDSVRELRYDGAATARPAPGVVEAIEGAAAVVIAPSNPPLSVWPTLAVPGVREAVAAKGIVAAVSPLFRGRALKGPAATVMADLGLPAGNAGVLAAYEGLISHLVVDAGDSADIAALGGHAEIHAADTRIADGASAARFAAELLSLLRPDVGTAPVR